MAVSEDLIIKLTVDAKGVVAGTADINRLFGALNKNAKKTIKTQKALKESIKGLGGSIIVLNQAMELATKSARILNATLGASIDTFRRYEKAVVGVGKTTGITGGELQKLGRDFQQMGTRIPVATNELLEIGRVAGQMGITASADILNFSDTIARLGVATDLSGEAAALALTRILNVTTTSVDKIDELGSAIVALGNNFAAGEAEIARTSTVIAQGIGQFGALAEEALALGTASRAMGIRFELAGSAITRSFVEVNRIIAESGDELDTLADFMGTTEEGIENAFGGDSVGFFVNFLRQLNKLEKTEVPQKLAEFNINGIEVLRVLPTLSRNIGEVERALALASGEMENATALTKESAAAFNTLDGDMIRIRNSFVNASSDIGKIFAPVIRSLRVDFQKLADDVRATAIAFQNVDFKKLAEDIAPAFESIALAISVTLIPVLGALAVAMAPTLLVMSTILAVIASIAVALDNMGINFKIIATRFSFELTQIDEGFLELQKKIETFVFGLKAAKTVMIGMANLGMGDTFNAAVQDLKKAKAELGKFDDKIRVAGITKQKAQEKLNEAIREQIGKEGEGAKKLIEGINKFVKDFKAGFVFGVKSLEKIKPKETKKDPVKKAAVENTSVIFDGIRAAFMEGSKIFEDITEDLFGGFFSGGDTKSFLDDISKTFSNAGTSISQAFSASGKAIMNPMESLESAFISLENAITSGDGFEGFLINLKMVFDTVTMGFKTLVIKPLGFLFKGLIEGLERGLSAVESIANLPERFMQFFQNLDQMLRTFINKLPEIANQLISSLGSLVGGILEMLPQFIQNLSSVLQTLFTRLGEIAPALIEGLIQGLTEFIKNLPAILGPLISMLGDMVAAFFSNLDELIISLLDSLGSIFAMLIAELPDILVNFLESLPDIVFGLIDSLLENVGVFVDAIIDFLISGGLERVIKAIIQAIPRIVVAVVKGVIRGLVKLVQAIFGGGSIKLPKLELDPKRLTEVGKQITKIFSGFQDKLFAVVDFNAQKRAGKLANEMRESFEAGTEGMVQKFKGLMDGLQALWDKLLFKLTEAWRHIWDTFLKPIVDGVIAVFQWAGGLIMDAIDAVFRVITGLIDLVVSAWNSVVTILTDLFNSVVEIFSAIWEDAKSAFLKIVAFFGAVFQKAGEILRPIFQFVDKVFKEFGKAITSVFKTVERELTAFFNKIGEFFEPVVSALKNLFSADGLKEVFKQALEPFTNLFNGLKGTLQGFFDDLNLNNLKDKFVELFNSLNPANLIKKMFGLDDFGPRGPVEKLLGISVPAIEFAEGGPVPGFGNADSVPALLTPGEFVLSKEMIQQLQNLSLITQDQFNTAAQVATSGGIKGLSLGGTLEEIGEQGKGAFDRLTTPPKSLEDFINVSAKGLEDIANKIGKTFSDLVDLLQRYFQTIKRNTIKGLLRTAESTVSRDSGGGTPSINAVSTLSGLEEIFAKADSGFLGARAMNRGGLVDSVPALLTPGEFVLNRSAVQSLGIGNLNAMNQGKMVSGDTTINFDVALTINGAGGELNENFVRQRLMPTIKSEFKKASLKGEFLMNQRGIRS